MACGAATESERLEAALETTGPANVGAGLYPYQLTPELAGASRRCLSRRADQGMFAALADPILPIFAILAVGYGLQRAGLFDVAAAQVVNRFVFYVAAPALVFGIIARAPIADLEMQAVGAYFISQMTVYAGTFLLMHYGMGRDKGEALLLGMTASFSNHVFFVLPIAERIHGLAATEPISGIILVDSTIVFCGSVLAVDLLQASSPSPRKVLATLARNPFVVAAALGVAAWAAGPLLPNGLLTYATFAGAAAAPASLLALGIILASRPLRPIALETWIVVVAKILVHPILVLTATAFILVSPLAGEMTLLVAAGPCGAMPFVIALRYGIPTETIARAVLISTLLSLLTLAVLGG